MSTYKASKNCDFDSDTGVDHHFDLVSAAWRDEDLPNDGFNCVQTESILDQTINVQLKRKNKISACVI